MELLFGSANTAFPVGDRDFIKQQMAEDFRNELILALTNLPGKCIVFMDNAPYAVDKPLNFSNKKTTCRNG